MNNFFNLDNPIFTFLGKVFDIMMLSFIYIICCIPIITIGPATTALYYTIVKVIRKNRGYIMREFFKSFKENFKVATISWIIILLFGAILSFNIQLTEQMKGTMGAVLIYTYRFAIIIIFSTTIYLFPVLSRFKVGVWQLFRTSFYLSIKHLPSTLLLALIALILGLASYLTGILLLFAPAICFYISSFLLERIFKKYIPKQEDNETDDVKVDEWYLE